MERVPVISEIADVIDSRKGGDPKVSYVAKLFSKAPDAALKKVGEEATEVVMAGKRRRSRPSDLRNGRSLVSFHGCALPGRNPS